MRTFVFGGLSWYPFSCNLPSIIGELHDMDGAEDSPKLMHFKPACRRSTHTAVRTGLAQDDP